MLAEPESNLTLLFTGKNSTRLQVEPVASLRDGQVLVQSRVSAVSAGTEMQFYRGAVPQGTRVDASLPGLRAEVSYPLPYGYACVGEVVGGSIPPPEAQSIPGAVDLGSRVFGFWPHRQRHVVGFEECHCIPDGVSNEAACLLPSMETAVSLVQDAAPSIGERIVVLGLGTIGALTLALLRRSLAADVVGIDPCQIRCERAAAFARATTRTLPEAADMDGFDAVVECSGHAEALSTAFRLAGFGGRVVVGSWYHQPVTLDIDTRMHRHRQTLRFSQVSTCSPSLRFGKARRLQTAWGWLARLGADALITHRVPFCEAPAAYDALAAGNGDLGQVVFIY